MAFYCLRKSMSLCCFPWESFLLSDWSSPLPQHSFYLSNSHLFFLFTKLPYMVMSFPLCTPDYTFPRPQTAWPAEHLSSLKAPEKKDGFFLLPSGLQWMSCQIHASPFSAVGKEDALPFCVSWYRTYSLSSITSYIPVTNLGSIAMTKTYPSTCMIYLLVFMFQMLLPLRFPPPRFPSQSPLSFTSERMGPPSVSPTLAYQVSSRFVISSNLKDPSYHRGPFKKPWNPLSLHQLEKK